MHAPHDSLSQAIASGSACSTETLKNAPYVAQPQDFYAAAVQGTNTLLLESAEMIHKRGTQSLIGVSCAVKVICHNRTVQLLALNENGKAFIQSLPLELLPAGIKVTRSAAGMPAQTDIQTQHGVQAQPGIQADDEGNQVQQADTLLATLEFLPNIEFCDEAARLKLPNPLDTLRLIQHMVQSLQQILFTGVIAFDFINTFEQVVDPEVLKRGLNTVPDLSFYLYDVSVVINHLNKTTTIGCYCFSNAESVKLALQQEADNVEQSVRYFVEHPVTYQARLTAAPGVSKQEILSKVDVDMSDAEFGAAVSSLKEHICAGDIFQVVPSRTFSLPCADVDLSFAVLKQNNPSPYMFCLKDPDFTLLGASPEFALRFDAKSREVAISPIAGTRPRGRVRQKNGSLGPIDPSLDERIELELRLDHKEVAEHIMLVDLARNDLARIAEPGTRHTANLLHVDKYQSVMHLVSDVTATLRHDLDGLHAYLSSMNMGTLSGAPKIMAHKLIYQYEQKRRGSYGGVVARLSADGSFDSCIAIRSALVKQGIAYVQAGCGVVYDSVEQAECDETRNKAASVLMAIAQANQLAQASAKANASVNASARASANASASSFKNSHSTPSVQALEQSQLDAQSNATLAKSDAQ